MSPGEHTGPGDRNQQPRPSAPAPPEEQMLDALERFQDSAGAAAESWDTGLPMQQGLDIMWVIGNIVREFRVFTTMLSRYRATGPDGQPDPALDAPNEQITEASQCLNTARVLSRIGREAISAGVAANITRGVPAGGDPARDGPGVAAAHAMYKALRVFGGKWHDPSGTAELRDQMVTETMSAMMWMQIAVRSLANGAPKPFGTTLTLIARNFDLSCEHLRESLICSATGNYQPGTEDLERQIHSSYPLLSEIGEAALPDGTPATGAPGLAAGSFPAPAPSTAALPADPALPQDSGITPIRPPGKRHSPPRRKP